MDNINFRIIPQLEVNDNGNKNIFSIGDYVKIRTSEKFIGCMRDLRRFTYRGKIIDIGCNSIIIYDYDNKKHQIIHLDEEFDTITKITKEEIFNE